MIVAILTYLFHAVLSAFMWSPDFPSIYPCIYSFRLSRHWLMPYSTGQILNVHFVRSFFFFILRHCSFHLSCSKVNVRRCQFFGYVQRFRSYSIGHLDLVNWITLVRRHDWDTKNIIWTCPYTKNILKVIAEERFFQRKKLSWHQNSFLCWYRE